MNEKVKVRLLAVGTIALPYLFILLMGVLNENGVISSKWSVAIMIIAVILFLGMLSLLYKNIRELKNKSK